MNANVLGAIATAIAVLASPTAAQALTGDAVTDSLWRVQCGTNTQMRLPGQVIGFPNPSWQLTVPHVSGSYVSSTAQFGIAEQYAVEERLVLTNAIYGSSGPHETVLTLTATRAVAFELRLYASVGQTGNSTGATGLAELDVGDDGTVELTASLGDVRQRAIAMSMSPGTLVIRTRTAMQGTGADPAGAAQLVANATVLAMFAPASWQVWGAGCSGTNGVPDLDALDGQRPWAGETFTIELTNLPAGTVFGLVGLSRSSWNGLPLPLELAFLGMPGCRLYQDIEGVWSLTPTAGIALWPIAIPANANLLGGTFMQQALVLDPNANAFGATTSNAGLATIGSRNS